MATVTGTVMATVTGIRPTPTDIMKMINLNPFLKKLQVNLEKNKSDKQVVLNVKE